MRILVLTFGSTGDVLPYVALGQGLTKRGHTVVVCANSRFESFITYHGLEYAYMSDEIAQLIESATGRNILEGLTGFYGFLVTVLKLMRKGRALQVQILNDTWFAAQQHKPDIIIFSPKNFAAVHFAEKLSIPAISAPLFPQFIPTAQFPALGFPKLMQGSRYNRFTYSVVRKISSLLGGKSLKKWRQDNGLPPAFCGIDICNDTSGNAIPVVNGYSASLVPAPDDWPESVRVSGFWFLEQSKSWSPPQELLTFLAVGPPPVYVGFGSMASSQSEKVSKIVISALTKCGVRGIIATGWGGLDVDNCPDTIFKVDGVPHDWLFPRVSAVVHHGGAGTTAAGLRAGRPTLICPIFGDQPFWGEVVHQLGAGEAPIRQRKLTADNLHDAITKLLTTSSIKKRALELGAQIKKEDGIAAAIAVIESEYANGVA